MNFENFQLFIAYLRELVPSESRSDYGRFCKEAKKLIEVVTGRPVRDPKDLTQVSGFMNLRKEFCL